MLDAKFSEAELKELVGILESPVNRKYQQLGPEMQNGFVQKLVGDVAPVLDPKLQATQEKVRALLGAPRAAAPASAASTPKARAK